MYKIVSVVILVFSCIFGRTFFNENILYPYVNSNTVKLFGKQGHGTGFFYQINKKKYIITNKHVCHDYKTMQYFLDGKKIITNVLYVDFVSDICILKAPENVIGLFLSNTESHQYDVFSIGYPTTQMQFLSKGNLFTNFKVSLDFGLFVIQNKQQYEMCLNLINRFPGVKIEFNGIIYYCSKTDFNLVNSSMHVYPGMSGSAVVDYYGRVVGVVKGMDLRTFNGYIIPVEILNRVIEDYEGLKK